MTNQHPITPPTELVRHWCLEAEAEHQPTVAYSMVNLVATKAARWGTEQELEACCALMDDWGLDETDLRFARRPKPPSLKEQAIDALERVDGYPDDIQSIFRALEALDD